MNDEQRNVTPTLETFILRLNSGRGDLEELAGRLECLLERLEGPTPEVAEEARAEPDPSSHNARMDRSLNNLQQVIDRIRSTVNRLEEHV